MSELLTNIRSGSHWKIIIRPSAFNEKRVVDRSALRHIVEKSAVRFGVTQLVGPYVVDCFVTPYSFPYVFESQMDGAGDGYHEGPDWIGQETGQRSVEIRQLWRFYQSGQFVCYAKMAPDWADFLHPKDVIIRFNEIFELAARLSRTEAGDDSMHLEITPAGIKEPLFAPPTDQAYRLSLPGPVRDVSNEMALRWIDPATSERTYILDLPTLKLATETRELALEQAVKLFQRFGWNPHLSFLRDYQDELLPRNSGALR